MCDAEYGLSIGRGAFNFTAGAWTHVRQTVALNTPGKQDGGFALEVNGQEVLRRDDVFYRDVPSAIPPPEENNPEEDPAPEDDGGDGDDSNEGDDDDTSDGDGGDDEGDDEEPADPEPSSSPSPSKSPASPPPPSVAPSPVPKAPAPAPAPSAPADPVAGLPILGPLLSGLDVLQGGPVVSKQQAPDQIKPPPPPPSHTHTPHSILSLAPTLTATTTATPEVITLTAYTPRVTSVVSSIVAGLDQTAIGVQAEDSEPVLEPVGFTGLFFSTFFGGHEDKYATPRDQYTWFKDFAMTIND